MKKKLLCIILSLALISTVQVPAKSKPKLTKSSITITKGKSYKLKIKGTKKKIKWTTKNKKIATISKKGTVKGRKKGTTYVYAKYGKKRLKCKVRVEEPYLYHVPIKFYTGTWYKLRVNGTKRKPKFYSSNKKVASISKTGHMKLLMPGKSKITIKLNDCIWSFTISVRNEGLNKTNLTMAPGRSYTLKFESNNGKIAHWVSSDSSIASISTKGKVFAKKEGNITITAYVSSKKYTCKISVKNRIKQPTKHLITYLGGFSQLKYEFEGSDSEYLMIEDKYGIAEVYWDDNRSDYVLQVIPTNVGTKTIKILSNDHKNTSYGYEYRNLKITVLPTNSRWITNSTISDLGGFVYQLGNYTNIITPKDNDKDGISKTIQLEIQKNASNNQIYSSNGIRYKIINGITYFNYDDLAKYGF